MTQLRTHCCKLTLALLLVLFLPAASALAAGDDKTTTITSADTNVKVQFLLGGKDAKGRTLPLVDVPPSADGHTFKIELQLFGSVPPPDVLSSYDCGDGKIVLAAPGANIDDVCPKDRRKPLGDIPIGGTGAISTLADGFTHQLIVTSGAGSAPVVTPRSLAPSSKSLFWGQVGVGLGANQFSSVNTCRSFLSVIPGATCNAEHHSFGFEVEGQLGFTRYFALSGSYNHGQSITRLAMTPTFTEHSTFQQQFETIMGRAILPIGRFSVFGEGGGAFAQNHLKEAVTLGSGPTSSSLPTSFHVNTISPAVGGGVHGNLFKHFGVGAQVQYFQAQKGPVLNEHTMAGWVFLDYTFYTDK